MRSTRVLPLLLTPALGLLVGCDALQPALRYEEAARQLRFTLDRVEPRLELAFPLEQSSLRLRLEVGVDNPSDQRLRTRQVAGALRLSAQGQDLGLGSVSFPEGADIAPKGQSVLKVDVVLNYGDLKSAWGPLSGAVLRHEYATWSLAGEARLEVVGIGFSVPFQVRKTSGQ
ncbi:LEA type 2 family protein [Geothrix sp. PMB-07]|uniref:NDR1/HIN1-like protein n=1 Tax=Geothrix sp. PMB-07 TaxID=3068640 RepID=UPI0027429422|nr:LEA type 2 family protein [Geothrix sp. PMB-07]WLT31309.1 LEA type 2 family protein [Geothrix sp. PMB-07]